MMRAFLLLLLLLPSCSMTAEQRSRAHTEQLMAERAEAGLPVYTHEEWVQRLREKGLTTYSAWTYFPAHLRRTR